jgi:MFS family permease
MLALVALAVLGGMSLWFVGSAVSAPLAGRWDLGPGQVGWLTGAVQLGFVAGTAAAAVLNLADLFPARGYFASCAALAAVANASLLVAPSYETALVARFVTGALLAGVYPPAMKMIATWFTNDRGLAIGVVVGALTVGKAAPYLLSAAERAGPAAVVLAASGAAIAAAALVGFGYRDGPDPFPRRRFSWSLAADLVRHRETRLATGAYLGHMWELYAMWTWFPAFLVASAAAREAAGRGAPTPGQLAALSFAVIAAGGAGCVWGGWAARRLGSATVAARALRISGLCAVLIGPLFGASLWLMVPVALVWGFFVVADSAQFSALVTHVAPPHAVGTALTLQTSLGFLLTLATIQGVPVMVDAVGWRWAFTGLALGPAAGLMALGALGRAPRNARRSAVG